MWKHLAGVACALALAAPASAAVVTLQGAGIAHGLDQSGLFGPGGDLSGLPAILTLSYDTALAPEGVNGVFVSGAADWLTLELSVGGVPFVFERSAGPSYVAMIELIEAGAADQFNLIFQTAGPVAAAEDVAQSLAISLTGDLFGSTGSLPLLNGALAASGFAAFSIDDVFCASTCLSLRRADGGVEIAGLAATGPAVTPVPEPATWAMMILGLGAVGAIRRHARRAVTQLFAPSA
jgi:hypothetical protein